MLEVDKPMLDFHGLERAFYALRAERIAAGMAARNMPFELAQQLVKPELAWNFMSGLAPNAKEQADAARDSLPALQAQIAALFERADVLCTPATLDGAFDAAVRYPSEQVGQEFTDYLGWMAPASIVTMMLCPAIVLPCGFLEDGRPVGLQLITAPWCDALALQAAARLEALLVLPKACPIPKRGTTPLRTVGPRTTEEARAHHGVVRSRGRL
eukprot:NODE_9353_length_1430_cov_2.880276.p1 GENE.NODE_9353_length_1430_cov_2.880276~~NODE_9353_length_1430_cov_2.880276.p1  ORF type:complete len:213 (+),score=65.90 NODE_9353_length_1430_cov_2.880276:726-1364(+)